MTISRYRTVSFLLCIAFILSLLPGSGQAHLRAETTGQDLGSSAETPMSEAASETETDEGEPEETEESEPYFYRAHPEDAAEPDPELQELFDEFFKSRNYAMDNVSYCFEDLYGNPLIEHNPDLPQIAASTVKIYTALWIAEAVDIGDVSFDDEITYYYNLHFEGGTGSLQTWITDGDRVSIGELLTLMIEESDNIAFHMLDRHFATTYGGQIATFHFADRLELALEYSNNVLTPHDLIYAYRIIYEYREAEPFVLLIDILKTSVGPTVFPNQDASHKPGNYGAAAGDAGILWLNDEPVFYAVLLEGSGDHEQTLSDLGDLFLETAVPEVEMEDEEAVEEYETVSTIFVPAK